MLASVLINNYNYGDFLEEAVTSVLAQSHDDIEIILVDDGSTDNSLQVIQALADTHSNVIVCSKPNGGQLSAFNAVYALAKGEVLFFLDADDRYHPDYVAKALAVSPSAETSSGSILCEPLAIPSQVKAPEKGSRDE